MFATTSGEVKLFMSNDSDAYLEGGFHHYFGYQNQLSKKLEM